MKSFFCIFCNSIFESRQQVYEHLRKIPFHDELDEGPEDLSLSAASTSGTNKCKPKYRPPTNCYAKLNIPDTDSSSKRSASYGCDENGAEDEIEDYDEAEKEFGEWIERFLLFQDSLQNYCKPINPVNRQLLKGCPVCDRIISVYNEISPEQLDATNLISLISFTNGSSLKARAHVNEHLRYFPYKCRGCLKKNRNKQYGNNEDFKKHVARMHSKEGNMLRKVKIRKLERYVEYKLKPMFCDIEDTDLYEQYSFL